MNKYILTGGILVILLLGVFSFFSNRVSDNQIVTTDKISSQSDQKTSTPYSASFAIYTNDTFRIFTDPMYHSRSNEVYITQENPNKVIVAKQETTWQDFFNTLPFQLSSECLVTGTGQQFCNSKTERISFFLNGLEDSDALSKEIKQNDKLLVSFGPIENPSITQQLEELSTL